MKKKFLSFVVSLGLALPGAVRPQAASAAPEDPAPPRASEAIPNQYIVVLQDGVDPGPAAEDLGRRHGLALMNVYQKALKGFSALIPPAKLQGVRSDPRVKGVGQDRTAHATAETVPAGIDRIDAEPGLPAHDGLGVNLAVIDTGIDRNHPDLAANIAGGVTKVTSEASTTTGGQDDAGHGTHVAGTAAAAHNAADVTGAAPKLSLYAVKVLNSQGSGSFSDIIAGIDWVADTTQHPFIQVANMSLGATCSVCTDDSTDPTLQAFHQAIRNAVALGTTFVVAAGNDGLDARTSVPASYDEVITVSALTDTDGKAGGLGPSLILPGLGKFNDDTFAKFSNSGADVDVIAPGVSVLSTKLGGGTTRMSGTSMASPHAAGTAALLIARNPGIPPGQVRVKLRETGECPDGSQGTASDCAQRWPGDPDAYGEPLVNANRASRAVPPPLSVAASLTTDRPSYRVGTLTARLSVVLADELGQPISGLPASAFSTALDGSPVPSAFAETANPGTYQADPDISLLAAGEHAAQVTATDGRGVSGTDTAAFTVAAPAVSVLLASDKSSYVQGQDASAVLTAQIRDELGEPVPGLAAGSFSSLLDGAAASLTYAETATPGTYRATLSLTGLATGSHSVQTTATDGRGVSGAGTASFNMVEPGPTARVESIAVTLSKNGKNWKGQAVVRITDLAGAPVSGASVTGDWRLRGSFLSSASAVTDAQGNATLTSTAAKASSGDVFQLTVTGVQKDGVAYDPSQNIETSDSASVP